MLLDSNELLSLGEEMSAFSVPVDDFSTPQNNGYIIIANDNFEKLIEEKVNEKINDILRLKEEINFKKVDDSQAKKEIVSFMLDMKGRGIYRINILDVIVNLNLPSEQIERIMKKFEIEKKITKISSYGRGQK